MTLVHVEVGRNTRSVMEQIFNEGGDLWKVFILIEKG